MAEESGLVPLAARALSDWQELVATGSVIARQCSNAGQTKRLLSPIEESLIS